MPRPCRDALLNNADDQAGRTDAREARDRLGDVKHQDKVLERRGQRSTGKAGSRGNIKVPGWIVVAAEGWRSGDDLGGCAGSLHEGMVDGLEIDFAVLVGDAAVDVIEGVRGCTGGDWEGELHFLIERRHRGGIDMQPTAKHEAGPIRELWEGSLIERRELKHSSLVKRSDRNN